MRCLVNWNAEKLIMSLNGISEAEVGLGSRRCRLGVCFRFSWSLRLFWKEGFMIRCKGSLCLKVMCTFSMELFKNHMYACVSINDCVHVSTEMLDTLGPE